jgi:hypothetical protein
MFLKFRSIGATTLNVPKLVIAKEIPAEEDAEEAEDDAAEEETTIVNIFNMLNVSIVANRATILLTAQSQEKMTMNSQMHMVSKSDFKNLFQSSLKEMLTKKTNNPGRGKTLKAMMNHWT